MNREETLALYAQGKDAWNAWAAEMLAERKRLQEAGAWAVEEKFGRPEPQNDATRDWMAAATADFSSREAPHTFEDDVGFSGWVFPWVAWFEGATFSGDAWFESATFSGTASFESATFSGTAWFKSATFDKPAYFNSAHFEGGVWFPGATFADKVRFDQATFDEYVTFAGARFHDLASFGAIRAERGFTLADARFRRVPDFIQAHFAEAPRFDNLSIRPGFVEPGRFWRRWVSRVKRLFDGDRDVPARWRALKRLAIQGHDHEREQLFFPMEIRSARFVTDWPLPLARPAWVPPQDAKEARRPWWARLPVVPWRPAAWQGFFRFWFGVAYGLLSSYGRSVVLPALWWLALIAVSAAIYLGESEIADGKRAAPFAARAEQVIAYAPPVSLVATPPAPTPCATVSGDKLRSLEPRLAARTDAVAEALQLAAANGSVLGGLGGPESARRTYGCLFGFVSDAGGNLAPIVPAFVSTWSLIQKTLSLILIFLLGLAVRNMLKMK